MATETMFHTLPSSTHRNLQQDSTGNRAAIHPPLFLVLLILMGLSDHRVQAAAPKNVLFIICDDLNTHVTPSGYQNILTPELTQFAKESLTFKRAYCQYPVCGPSRASLLSGLYPESSKVLDNKADIRKTLPGRISIPQNFKEQGYWTASAGKIFHSPRHQPGVLAWDQQIMFENDELPLVTEAKKRFEAQFGSVEERKNRKKWKAHLRTLSTQTRGQTPPGYGPTSLRDEQHKDGKNARAVRNWIQSKAFGDQPFFIACGIQKPHVPFLAPKKYFQLYPKDSLPPDITPASDWNDIPPIALVKRFTAFGFEAETKNDDLRREYMQAYHACISFIDAQIGLILNTLRESSYWEDTIVIVTSDHGYHLGEHFLWGKVSLFEECARTPLLIRVPGMTQANTTTSALVEHVDFYPTLAELCNLQTSQELQGTSFTPVLKNPRHQGKQEAYTVVSRGKKLGRSIRTARWRYAEWESSTQAELYDLENDPLEFDNLINDPKWAELKLNLRHRLNEAQKRASLPLSERL